MSEADFLAALRGHWLDGWDQDRCRYAWEDDPVPAGPESWMRVILRVTGGTRVAVGRSREETRGLVSVELYAQREGGPGPGERLIAEAGQLWRGFRHTRVRTRAPSILGLPPEGAFNRHLMTLGWVGDLRLEEG